MSSPLIPTCCGRSRSAKCGISELNGSVRSRLGGADDIIAVANDAAERFRPERIILFGSYTYGRPTADSDVHLLIVMPH
jgi:hypothetical protein